MKRFALAVALAALPFAATPAHAQYKVVPSCPGTTQIQGTGGGYGTAVVDIFGNVCATSSSGGGAAPLNPVSHAATSALAATLVAKAAAGNLYGFYCNAITGVASGQCIAYNSATAPATGALTGTLVLDSCAFISSAGCSLTHAPNSVVFGTGIVVIISAANNPFTYTAGATGFIGVDYQ
jgi:hypothetical protein